VPESGAVPDPQAPSAETIAAVGRLVNAILISAASRLGAEPRSHLGGSCDL